jgi:hypothetical protein
VIKTTKIAEGLRVSARVRVRVRFKVRVRVSKKLSKEIISASSKQSRLLKTYQ